MAVITPSHLPLALPGFRPSPRPHTGHTATIHQAAGGSSNRQCSAAAARGGADSTSDPASHRPSRTLVMAAAESSSWSDLPPELLGLVLKRLPSLADRVRLRAVCQPWRCNARLPSPSPPLPYLTLLDGTFLSIPDGGIIRMDVPDDARCYCSIGSWLFLMRIDRECSLMNPFSKAKIDLPKLPTVWHQGYIYLHSSINPLFYKVVVPSPLDSSPESLVIVMILDSVNWTVCICQPPFATDFDLFRGRIIGQSWFLYDVAFLNGKLYGLVSADRLVIFEIGYDLVNKPKITSSECVINSWDFEPGLPQHLSREEEYLMKHYLVECCGRLLKVERCILFEHFRTVGFNVFEADLSTNPGQWIQVNKLGGQALFVGKHGSKCFAAEEYNGILEDCIYFMYDYPEPDCDASDPLYDSGVYNIRNGMITPLLSETAAVPQHHGGQCLAGEKPRDTDPGALLPFYAVCVKRHRLRRIHWLVAAAHDSSRALTVCMMNKEARSSSWPDLQPELLELVLRRLPSLTDQVRLRAVCRPWRSSARLLNLPLLLPWLSLLDGTLLSIPDGKIIRMPKPDNAFCRGSCESWLFFVHKDGGCSLMNPFSKATLDLSKLVKNWFNARSIYTSSFDKMVVQSPLESSPDSIVALMLNNGWNIRICQPPVAIDLSLWSTPVGWPISSHLNDIALLNGKLYGICGDELSTFEIIYGLDSKPKISCVKCITNYPCRRLILPQPLHKSCVIQKYLVECCGKLLMVNRMIEWNDCTSEYPLESERTVAFEVFEADLSTKPGQWICVSKLGGQALFVGKHCSKSFPADECTGIQEDCIYFICDYIDYISVKGAPNSLCDPLRDCGVYNMRNGKITPLLSESADVPKCHGGSRSCCPLRGSRAAGPLVLSAYCNLHDERGARSSSWPDLQPELLELVLRRLPSLTDHVRLRAVCHPWRSNARLLTLPPLLPWLSLPDGSFLSIPHGKIIRMPKPDNTFCSGSSESWLFFVHRDGGCSLMNPFSKATLELSKVVKNWFNASSINKQSFHKMVVQSPLESSPGSIVALILNNGWNIRICQPPFAIDLSLWSTLGRFNSDHLYDIAFLNGKLYGICGVDEPSTFEIIYGLDNKPKISCLKCITTEPRRRLILPQPLPKSYITQTYLVECCGKLLMVQRMIKRTDYISECPLEFERTVAFEVFEADLSTKPGEWICVSKLGGQALFIGKHCSKSFPADECTGIQEDCIYFMRDYIRALDPLQDSAVYNMRNGKITPLLSKTAVVPQNHGGQWRECNQIRRETQGSTQPSSWSDPDLPPELLALVLKRRPSPLLTVFECDQCAGHGALMLAYSPCCLQLPGWSCTLIAGSQFLTDEPFLSSSKKKLQQLPKLADFW
ncbi:hypothetical protein U9M48_029752 [Paspalum notatum var. saurae]|uniref:F-box domain-containing protein n=1 Tax=Paspalum notatum var. saurae TaxID=547442 RepID=A0AAQ3X311_PASNO